MKNEAMARALKELDDELIEQANTRFERKRKSGPARIFAAAAGFVIIFAALFVFLSGGKVEVSVNGAVLSGVPVEALSPQTSSAVPARSAFQSLSIPLDIKAKGKVTVTAFDGILRSEPDSEGGKTVSASGDFSVLWILENAEAGKEYRLSVDEKTDLILSFDESLNKWTIIKNTRR